MQKIVDACILMILEYIEVEDTIFNYNLPQSVLVLFCIFYRMDLAG